ncbi:NLI interacting factor [Pelomyxa schiedti]|nr:NLI interacting factor [Pelomyxa schiedti]
MVLTAAVCSQSTPLKQEQEPIVVPEKPKEKPAAKKSGISALLCSVFSVLFNPLIPRPLLEEPHPSHVGKKTLVLDLDDTLVHSSFQPVEHCDMTFPIELEGKPFTVYLNKRPGLDEFLRYATQNFEVVVFTASLKRYADPVINAIDPDHTIPHRLYRGSCTMIQGHYIKDLSRLGRELRNCIIVDNSPVSYALHAQHAIPISTYVNSPHDRCLDSLRLILDQVNSHPDVCATLKWVLKSPLAADHMAQAELSARATLAPPKATTITIASTTTSSSRATAPPNAPTMTTECTSKTLVLTASGQS